MSSVKSELRRRFSETSYGLFFSELQLLSLEGENGAYTAVVSVPTSFKQNILEKNHSGALNDVFSLILGSPCVVVLVTDEPKTAYDPKAMSVGLTDPPTSPEEVSLTAGTEDFVFHSEYTFDNFIVGDSNKFAHAACVAVSGTPGSVYNPLFIYGHSGLGKTHLMYAVTNELKRQNSTLNVVYIKCEEFTNQLIAAIANKSTQQFREKFRRADVLLMDDVQFVAGKTSTQEELFHTFNTLYDAGKQIIFTSDRPARDIKLLEDRIKTRCEWGLIADIQPPDPELRCAIIKKKSEAMDLPLTTEVINFLSDKLKSNVRQIEGTLKRLKAMCFVMGSEATVELASKCVADIVPEEVPVEAKTDRILSEVASRYGVEVKDLLGKSRTKSLSWARHVAVYVLRKKTDLSLPAIGKRFGRDHSTIISSLNVIEKELNSNPAFAVELNELLNYIE